MVILHGLILAPMAMLIAAFACPLGAVVAVPRLSGSRGMRGAATAGCARTPRHRDLAAGVAQSGTAVPVPSSGLFPHQPDRRPGIPSHYPVASRSGSEVGIGRPRGPTGAAARR